MIKEEAIEILSDMRAEYNIFSDDEEEATRYHALSWAIRALNEQQRTGRWIDTDRGESNISKVYCSICMKEYIPRQWMAWKYGETPKNYCPNCGARMEAEE